LRARLRADPVLAGFIDRLKHPEDKSSPPPSGPGGVR
jgi:hypothetical protein